MKYKKTLMAVFLAVVSLVFVFMPWPASDLYIRVHFSEINGGFLQLFYTTASNNTFCEEQCITSEVDTENKQVTFCLDKSLSEELTGLRIDFASMQDLVGVKSITVSSAGVIQEEYNPVHFFDESNIVGTNGIEISLVKTRNRAYIATSENDPHVVLSAALTEQIAGNYSHFRGTRLCICVFILGCVLLTKKNIFQTRK
ncbi:MAG: hypothetical protein IJZ82_11295 [Lachnospiraceae bacterium]|nr:hypothetical protein [Lachnospiraceae bacterium]